MRDVTPRMRVQAGADGQQPLLRDPGEHLPQLRPRAHQRIRRRAQGHQRHRLEQEARRHIQGKCSGIL